MLNYFVIPNTYCSPESYAPADKDVRTGRPLDVGVHSEEAPGNAKQSDGFFEKGLLTAMESVHVANAGVNEVKVVGNGHCHSASRRCEKGNCN